MIIPSIAVMSGGVSAAAVTLGTLSVPVLLLAAGMLGLVAVLLAAREETSQAASPDGGSRAVARYLEVCVARDGEPDFARHRLSRREAFFERIESDRVTAPAPIGRESFLANLARRRPEPGLSERALFLLATARVNQAERFGVGLAELYGRIHEASDRVRVHVALQEHYHTRMLADVVAIFGLPVPAALPPLAARFLIRLLVNLPEHAMLPLTGASEMAGCVSFRMLRDRGVALFADDPPVADRIRLLYDEILADEIGHVGYIAAQLGSRGRRAMRFLYRRIGAHIVASQPEMQLLFGRDEIRRRFARDFPLDEIVDELPGRAFAVARP
jgi:hypothetical protein